MSVKLWAAGDPWISVCTLFLCSPVGFPVFFNFFPKFPSFHYEIQVDYILISRIMQILFAYTEKFTLSLH